MNSNLFTPYQLGPITLRNRTIRSAAFENWLTTIVLLRTYIIITLP